MPRHAQDRHKEMAGFLERSQVSLRAELAALGLSSLQRRASGSRAQVQAIDSALDSSSPKEALISLIVSVELDGIERAEEGVPPTDGADDDDEDDEHPPSADDALAALAELGHDDHLPSANGTGGGGGAMGEGERCEKRHFLRHLCIKRSFYQDRLGTNIGKAQKKSGVFAGCCRW